MNPGRELLRKPAFFIVAEISGFPADFADL
jgi:hypothetical protein